MLILRYFSCKRIVLFFAWNFGLWHKSIPFWRNSSKIHLKQSPGRALYLQAAVYRNYKKERDQYIFQDQVRLGPGPSAAARTCFWAECCGWNRLGGRAPRLEQALSLTCNSMEHARSSIGLLPNSHNQHSYEFCVGNLGCRILYVRKSQEKSCWKKRPEFQIPGTKKNMSEEKSPKSWENEVKSETFL